MVCSGLARITGLLRLKSGKEIIVNLFFSLDYGKKGEEGQ